MLTKRPGLNKSAGAQARRIYAWLDGTVGSGVVQVGNTSDEPVYNVVVYMVYMDGAKPGTGEESERDLRETLQSLRGIEHLTGNLIDNALVHPAKQSRAIVQVLPHGT